MKEKCGYISATVILSSTLFGCVPTNHVHQHSNYRQSTQNYREYQNREYEVVPQPQESYRYNQRHHRQDENAPQYQERESHHNRDRNNEPPPRQQQIERPTEREQQPLRQQRPQIKLQERSTFQTPTPSVQTLPVINKQKIEQPEMPAQIASPPFVPPTILKTPPMPSAQPCSRRVGCEDSQSNNPNSSSKE